MNISIRKAVLEDTNSLISILSAAVQHKLNHQDMSWGTGVFSEREVRGLIKTDATYTVLSDGEVIGTFGLHWQDERVWGDQPPNAGYVHRLAVRDDLHGQDLGLRIIDWAVAEVARNGRQYLRLDCDSSNTKLRDYYEKQGFKEIGKKHIPPHKNYFATLYERQV
jgi:ribosomal protein S18 acetylase RimI-like enzyme